MANASDYIRIDAIDGMHMNSPEAAKIMLNYEWNHVWPEVDDLGYLTGDVLDSDADVILVDWVSGKLSNRDGHACEACIRRYNAPEALMAALGVER